jgi:hypothetical protein
MKKILILSSLFIVICFAVGNISLAKRNASMSLQMENVEALTLSGPIFLNSCYWNVSVVNGSGIYFYTCSPGTTIINGEKVIYPCGHEGSQRIESTQNSVSNRNSCYSRPSAE